MRKIIILLLTILIFSCNPTEDQLFQKSDLENLTITDLRIKRNEIFAKHGYIFKSKDLADYFSKFDWYNPTNQNVDSLLTEADRANIKLIIEIENEIKNYVIDTEPETINNYKKLESSLKSDFIDKLTKTVIQFSDRKADTTILQICNIDNLGKLDTIKNQVYYYKGNVFVNSAWTKDGEKLWEQEIKNPYLWIGDSDEFQFDTRKPWVTYTIAIYYGIPDIENIDYYSHIDKEMIQNIGIDWAKRKNISISRDEYAKYLENFKGDIIAYGHPENRDGLIIWYEPIKDFVLFYAP